MKAQDKLKCFRCQTIPSSFVLLNCNHLLCSHCLSHYANNSTSQLVTVVCNCGVRSIVEDSNTGVFKSPTQESRNNWEGSSKSSPKLRLTKELKIGDTKDKYSFAQEDTIAG